MKKIIIISIIVLVVIGISSYVAFNYIGNKAFDTLMNSVPNPTSVEQLEQSSKEQVQEQEKPSENITNATDETKQPNDNEKAPVTSPPPVQKDITSGFTNKKIDFQDKKDALSLVYSKLSSAEISMIQNKISGKLTSQDIKEIKALVKSRFTKQDIDQIIYWYNKYK